MVETFFILLKNASLATLVQIGMIFGVFFACGAILAFFQERTAEKYYSTLGWYGVLLTAWIGTPIHEFGHLIFAILFRHRVTGVAFFRPNKKSGELGYVNHSFHPLSLYQRLGNFFIGAAPMIIGIPVLSALLYLLIPGARDIFSPLMTADMQLARIPQAVVDTIITFYRSFDPHDWRAWIFVYLSFCVAAHLAPSRTDRKLMWGGLTWIVGIILLLNLLTLALNIDMTMYISRLSFLSSFLLVFCVYALIVSVIHYIFTFILSLLMQ